MNNTLLSQMRQIILLIIPLLGLIGCIGNGTKQQEVRQTIDQTDRIDNHIKNKKFDIAAFDRHKKDYDKDNRTGYKEILPNDTFINCFKYKEGDSLRYVVVKYPKNSYLCYESVYYENGNIKSETTQKTGGSMCTGISRYYSIDGELQQEINEDAGYSFTFEQLMNLLNKKGMHFPKGVQFPSGDIDFNYPIHRHTIEGKKAYFATYPLSDTACVMIYINGNDGSIIREHHSVYKEYE